MLGMFATWKTPVKFAPTACMKKSEHNWTDFYENFQSGFALKFVQAILIFIYISDLTTTLPKTFYFLTIITYSTKFFLS